MIINSKAIIHEVSEIIREIAFNPKIGVTVAGSTVGTGVGTILELIPDDIGKLATVIGIILSSVLIYTHWRKGRIEYKKTQLENQKIQLEIKKLQSNEAERAKREQSNEQ